MVDHYEIQNRTVINLKTVDRNGVLHVNVCLFIYLFKHPPARTQASNTNFTRHLEKQREAVN